MEAGKHAIMRRACLPARDLRILDPVLSYPSTILGREHAIVVNLEHIKAIITAQEVLLLNFKDPAVAPFVLDLQHRLPLHFNALGQQVGFPFLLQDMPIMKFFVPSFSESWRQVFFSCCNFNGSQILLNPSSVYDLHWMKISMTGIQIMPCPGSRSSQQLLEGSTKSWEGSGR